jgi:hypothetical protein
MSNEIYAIIGFFGYVFFARPLLHLLLGGVGQSSR